MRLERHRGAAKFAAGLAIGVAIGAGVTLLFAPQSGEDTRHSIARHGRHWRRRGHDAWDDLAFEFKRAKRRWHRRRHRARVNGAP